MKKINVSKSVVFSKKVDDLEKAIEYLNKEGYFSDHENFSEYKESRLLSIKVANNAPFPYESRSDNHNFSYFIPKDKAVFESEEPEKYYRAFKNIEEFLDNTNLGHTEKVQFLEFRTKHSNDMRDTYYLAYMGYEVDQNYDVSIHLGALIFSFYELFNYYEYTLNGLGEWLPFGVECEEDEAEYM